MREVIEINKTKMVSMKLLSLWAIPNSTNSDSSSSNAADSKRMEITAKTPGYPKIYPKTVI